MQFSRCQRTVYMADVKGRSFSLLWSTAGKTALAKGFWSNMGDTKYPCGDEEQKRLAHDITIFLLWTHPSFVCDNTMPKAMFSQLLNSDNSGGGVNGGSPLTLYIKNKISRYIYYLTSRITPP